MAKVLKTSVKDMSARLILIGLALLVSLNLLSRFDIVNVTSFQPDILTIVASLFLLSEVGIMRALSTKRKNLTVLDWFIAAIGIAAILGVVFAAFGLPVNFLTPFQGVVELGLLIFVLVEIFRKNR